MNNEITSNELVTGSSSNDAITTGNGNDTIMGSLGNDTINAQEGMDWISYKDIITTPYDEDQKGIKLSLSSDNTTLNIYNSHYYYEENDNGDTKQNHTWQSAFSDEILNVEASMQPIKTMLLKETITTT